MASNISINMAGTNSRIKSLSNIDAALMAVGERTKDHLLKNWLQARGGDEKPFKKLSKEYAERKAATKVKVGEEFHGGDPIPNMTLTGNMTQGLQSTKQSKTVVHVGFVTDEQGKAAGNQQKRKGMMKLTQQFKDKAIKYVLNYIKGAK